VVLLEEREGEIAAVGRVLDAARDGAGRGLLVEGPPGIGKTRLLLGARIEPGGYTYWNGRLEPDVVVFVGRDRMR
jgi:DNA helicase TIP49 (TBP-interacting protein)